MGVVGVCMTSSLLESIVVRRVDGSSADVFELESGWVITWVRSFFFFMGHFNVHRYIYSVDRAINQIHGNVGFVHGVRMW